MKLNIFNVIYYEKIIFYMRDFFIKLKFFACGNNGGNSRLV